MSQRLFQGRTNNHLTWVMVDATDFATPESALSAATKIKIYGKLQGATGVNFVSSGTGSLTNDIQHVGASVLGIYTIALAKADLSDASAAWYDQYVVSLSATGAAYQALVCEGVLTGANPSNLSAAISDTQSYLAVMSGVLSDAYSAAAQINSRVLLAQSFASDAASAAAQANSRVLLAASAISDIDSALTSQFTYTSAALSDIDSALSSQFNAISDLASNAYSAAVVAASQATIAASYASDVYSAVTSNRTEPGQGAPAASTSALAKLDYLYKAWRNHTKQTSTKYQLFNDASTVVDQSAAVSADADSFIRAEVGTGV